MPGPFPFLSELFPPLSHAARATDQIFESVSLSTLAEGAALATGTLADGFAELVWLCLADGCYEIDVGGGAAESEVSVIDRAPLSGTMLRPRSFPQVSFDLRDEHGEHFEDHAAPFADHFCAQAGDLFEHPTAAPTVTPLPSMPPTLSSRPTVTARPSATGSGNSSARGPATESV